MNEEGNSEYMNFTKERFFDDTDNSLLNPMTPKEEENFYNSNSHYQTGGFLVSEKDKNIKENYFLKSGNKNNKNNINNIMETIIEDDKDNEDRSNYIIRNNLAIPPEKIIDIDGSQISNNSIFLPHLINKEIKEVIKFK
jgi:hypothetical protein